jgi:hypothetical protein
VERRAAGYPFDANWQRNFDTGLHWVTLKCGTLAEVYPKIKKMNPQLVEHYEWV